MHRCGKCREYINPEVDTVNHTVRNGKYKVRHVKCIRYVKSRRNPVIGKYIGIDAGCKDDSMAIIELSTPQNGKGFFYNQCFPYPKNRGSLPISYSTWTDMCKNSYLAKPLTVPGYVSPCVTPGFEEWKAIHMVDLTPNPGVLPCVNPYKPWNEEYPFTEHQRKLFEQEYLCTFTSADNTSDVKEVNGTNIIDFYNIIFGMKSEKVDPLTPGSDTPVVEVYDCDTPINRELLDAKDDYFKALSRYKEQKMRFELSASIYRMVLRKYDNS